MSADTVATTVSGWGRTAPTAARVIRPRTYEEVAAALRDCGPRGGIPRGLGRAYGDAAQNAGGAVIDMTGLDRIHAPELLAAMYPRLDDFRALRAGLDPRAVFTSDLSRRLAL